MRATNNQGTATQESAPVLVAEPGLSPQISVASVAPASGFVGDEFEAIVEVSGNPAPELAYQWMLDGKPLSGAASGRHIAAEGGSLSVVVTASNPWGSDTRESAAVVVAPALAAPRNTELPTIAGTPAVGATLSATSDGSWSGNPTPALARNWQRNGTDIPGATGTSYQVGEADAGALLRLRVTATNTQGSATAVSSALLVPAFTAPVVSAVDVAPGSGTVGTTFTASYVASGDPTPSVAFQWRLDGAAILGANGATYLAAAPGNLSVGVTATNSQGTTSRESAAVVVDPALAAPQNTELPAIAGTPAVGATLTATSDGSWTGSPTPTLSRNWQRNGTDIPGATGTSYQVGDADAGATLRLRVTATNSQGSATAVSGALSVPAYTAPAVSVVDVAPASGTVGTTFTASYVASGNPAPSVAFQWRLYGVAITGANGTTYLAAAAGNLSVVVTATNSEGTTSRESGTVVVSATPPGNVFALGVFEVGVFA